MTSKASLPSKLLATDKLKLVHLEMTSKCNLRCTYCAVSQHDYKGYDIDASSLGPLLDDLHELGVEAVALNGHGETTFHEDWKTVLGQIVGKFPQIELTTNLAVKYSAEGIELLSQVMNITVSLDTHDPLLLRETRRSVNLGTIIDNIARIRSAALSRRRDKLNPYHGYELLPRFRFSCVVHDKNILQLPAFAHFAVAMNVTHVIFCNLTKYKDIPGATNVQPVCSLTDTDELVAAREALQQAKQILDENGVVPVIQDGLTSSIDEAIANSWREQSQEYLTLADVKQPHTATLSAQRTFRTPEKGQTRDCLDPWDFSIVYATGKVAPCCWHDPMHTLGKHGSLLDILSSEKTTKLRKQLLTGRLNKFCKTCPARGLISIDELRNKVATRDKKDE